MPTIHLVSNAHLDPVWAWSWDEGLVEAIATFRIAAEMLEKYPEYVFVRGESLLYEWVEEHDPTLFKRISASIRAGRWIIVGGWYLQPDCNIPGGESLVRQALVGKTYFIEKFGIEPLVAYNVDSFGHNAGLPQIIHQSGSRFYIHFRPGLHEKTLPEVYRWRGVDGTEVITARPIQGGYCTEPGALPDKILTGIQRARESGQDVLLFWGVGDHGGGATRAELDQIRTMAAENSDITLQHSHPAAFFDVYTAQNPDLPVVADELQRSFSGCYTSAAAVKRAHRQAEGLLAQAERLATLAAAQVDWAYPSADLHAAWKDLLFNEFHDSLAGTTSKPAMQDLLDIFGRCTQTARKIRLGAALALAAAQPPVNAAIPIYVFNPHAQPFSGPVEADFMLEYRPLDWTGARLPVEVTDSKGQSVLSQEGISTFVFPLDWRKKLYFWAEVPPLSSACFLVRRVDSPAQTRAATIFETDTNLSIETSRLAVTFDRQSGALTHLTDRSTGQEYLRAGIQALVMNDPGDSWGTNIPAYRDLAGAFTPAPAETIARLAGKPGQPTTEPALKVVSQGPLCVIVDSLLAYGASTLLARYTFYPHTAHFDLTLKILWNEPNHMLKLAIPTVLKSSLARAEISYGAIQRPADGTEYPAQRWTFLEDDGKAIGLVNTGQYGYDMQDGELRLSLLRSPQYAALIAFDQIAQLERTPDFIDIGPHEIHLSLLVGPASEALPATIRLAQDKNIPPIVLPYFQAANDQQSNDTFATPASFLAIEPSTIVLGALKQAEDGRGWIIRLHESAGQSAQAQLTFATGQTILLSFSPYELKTFRWQHENLTHCDLLERPI
jgi:alpha-mannosidase